MFDTHAHIHDGAFDADRDAMLERARTAGVERILSVGTDLATSRAAGLVARRYGLDYSIGIHPHEAESAPPDLERALDGLCAELETPPAAVGEMGLDYYYDHSPREVQARVLETQLRYATERGLAAIFHQRDAFADFAAILRRVVPQGIRGVVHCFTEGPEQARILVDEFGLRLGIGGVATFKSAQNVRDAIGAVGIEHLILETDCPYLAPVPYRGKRNEPAFIAATAAMVASVLNMPVAEVVEKTSITAGALFRS